jgi:DNA polymerase-3 subunit epsilon
MLVFDSSQTGLILLTTFFGPIPILWVIEKRFSERRKVGLAAQHGEQFGIGTKAKPIDKATKVILTSTRGNKHEGDGTNSLASSLSDDPRLSRTYRFLAIDVETANSQKSSICQIGIAMAQEDGKIETLGILIDPHQSFDKFNINLHGIDHDTIRGASTFEAALQALRPFLERHILIQHSNFDRVAFDDACLRYDIPKLTSSWIDSVQIARNAWPELKGNGGHGLASLKKHLNLKFKHHDAEHDAHAAAQVAILAEAKTGRSFYDLALPKSQTYQPSIAVEGNQNGPLFGHVACFTGQIKMPRAEAATFAAGAGITVKATVSKKLTLLIVGDQDMTSLAGHDKSSKHRKAEELVLQGHKIRIIGETEFLSLISTCRD